MRKNLFFSAIILSSVFLTGCRTMADKMADTMGLTEEEKTHLTVNQKIRLTELGYQRHSSLAIGRLATSAEQTNMQNAANAPYYNAPYQSQYMK